MTNEYFLHPVSPTEAARIPFPVTLPLADRDAYMAAPPADAIADAARVPLPSVAHVEIPAAPADIVLDQTEAVDALRTLMTEEA